MHHVTAIITFYNSIKGEVDVFISCVLSTMFPEIRNVDQLQ